MKTTMDNNLTGRRVDIQFRPVISFNKSSYNSMVDGIDLIVSNLGYYIQYMNRSIYYNIDERPICTITAAHYPAIW